MFNAVASFGVQVVFNAVVDIGNRAVCAVYDEIKGNVGGIYSYFKEVEALGPGNLEKKVYKLAMEVFHPLAVNASFFYGLYRCERVIARHTEHSLAVLTLTFFSIYYTALFSYYYFYDPDLSDYK